MSKRGFISRYMLIVKRLRSKPYSSFDDLARYIDKQAGHLQLRDDSLNMGFSLRTFQRDVKEIRELFGLNIEYSKSNKGYFVGEGGAGNMGFQRMLEAFDLFNSMNLSHDLESYILLEKRRPQGTEHLHGLVQAIKNRLTIKFDYQKFWEDQPTHRTAEPLVLKEFKNRWYLIALDGKDGKAKTFPLDRLSNLEVTKATFVKSTPFDAEERFRHSFGIITPEIQEPEEIILSFDPIQGKYLKSLPLHESQEILVDDEDELRIRLYLWVTHDLVMELLSYGAEVKVLQPLSLVEMVRKSYRDALAQYGQTDG